MDNTPVSESELKAKATGRRVTLEDVEAAIASVSFFRAGEAADHAVCVGHCDAVSLSQFDAMQCLTFCVIVLKNGFTVTGQSACADPNNYNAEIGQRIARQDAVNKIWPLLGYALRDEMHKDQELLDGRAFSEGPDFGVYIGTKVVHATPMSRAVYNDFRGWTMPENEQDDEGYLVQYTESLQGNDSTYLGYISWSPKDVFERSYRAVGQGAGTSASEGTPTPAGKAAGAVGSQEEKEETWVDRLMAEFRELHERVLKLELFISKPEFNDLDVEDRTLLVDQYRHMIGYHGVLSARVTRATPTTEAGGVRLH